MCSSFCPSSDSPLRRFNLAKKRRQGSKMPPSCWTSALASTYFQYAFSHDSSIVSGWLAQLSLTSRVQPTDDDIVKLAIHDSGVVYYPAGNTDRPVSTPRTVSSHGDDGLRVPQSYLRRLRGSLRGIYPALAEKPFAATRLCW